jgi:hypothetical protein
VRGEDRQRSAIRRRFGQILRATGSSPSSRDNSGWLFAFVLSLNVEEIWKRWKRKRKMTKKKRKREKKKKKKICND